MITRNASIIICLIFSWAYIDLVKKVGVVLQRDEVAVSGIHKSKNSRCNAEGYVVSRYPNDNSVYSEKSAILYSNSVLRIYNCGTGGIDVKMNVRKYSIGTRLPNYRILKNGQVINKTEIELLPKDELSLYFLDDLLLMQNKEIVVDRIIFIDEIIIRRLR